MPTIKSKSISSSASKKNSPWHLGNVTVRSAFRLADALRVLAGSQFNGNLGTEQQQAPFLSLLVDRDVVARADGSQKQLAWVGRKWRSAMYQLGFVTPELTRGLQTGGVDPKIVSAANGLPDIDGHQYSLTLNGKRLANATSTAGAQDCFLRSILAYRVPTGIEKRLHQGIAPFSPLRIVLKTLLGLNKAGLESKISFEEMASIVQFCKSEAGINELIETIALHRSERGKAPNKKKFDAEYRAAARSRNGSPVGVASMGDYADTNFRYLKATGLVSGQASAIVISDGKGQLVDQIVSSPDQPYELEGYLRQLWSGARLPTDGEIGAVKAIRQLEQELESMGSASTAPDMSGKDAAQLNQIRLELLEERRLIRERNFGVAQRNQIEDILRLMTVMEDRKQYNEEYHSEAPAYLEWMYWRAFLAINDLANKPWEVRQFDVGEDLQPLFHAPARRPDILCEFDNWALVVEVTFTQSDRQEAMEGVPVRRHVADVTDRLSKAGKDVVGLFLAPSIDPNTATTFATGSYMAGHKKVAVSIVPMTFEQFRRLFEAGFMRKKGLSQAELRHWLNELLNTKNNDGHIWKQAIAVQISRFLKELSDEAA